MCSCPGYTHMQIAMPSSFGLWLGAYAESLADDLLQLKAAYALVNTNPLGSGAGYGSSVPLDRKMTTRLLGFDDLAYNSIYAQMQRGKTERTVLTAIAAVAATVGTPRAGRVPLFVCQFRIRASARCLHYGVEHHAPQEESRYLRTDPCPL